MTETSPQPESPSDEPQAKEPARQIEVVNDDKTFDEAIEFLFGRIVTIANSESYEEAHLGHQITQGVYRARLLGRGKDYIIAVAEFSHGSGKKATKEPVKQYIPLNRIKRVSIMKTVQIIHI